MRSVLAHRALVVFCMTALVASGACAPSSPLDEHGISASLAVSKRWAAPGSPVELTYRFDVAEDGGGVSENHEVFVNFVDAAGAIVFADDHAPPAPVSSWQPGSTIQYPRTIFVPHGVEVGPTTIELGLREPERGLRVGGP